LVLILVKAIAITLMCCATALGCVWILVTQQPIRILVTQQPSRTLLKQQPSQPIARYQAVQADERFPTGWTQHSLFRLDTATGQMWRLGIDEISTAAKTDDGKPARVTVQGWEEIPGSLGDQIQETWKRLGTPPPIPRRTP
jgi:hypothetical protein